MMITIEMTCPFCGASHAVEVNMAQYEQWMNGELIQNAMPDLSATEREQLISRLCPVCQTTIFENPEEEEDWEADLDYVFDDDFGFDPYEGCYTYDC